MSAFIVDDAHIDFLVTYAIGGGPSRVSGENPQKLGQMLVDQNTRSVNWRYRDNAAAATYVFRPFTGPMTPVAVIKACDCYDHQACETEDYEKTQAARLVDAIRSKAIRSLTGYDLEPWEVQFNPGRRSGAVLLSSLCR